MDFAFLLPFDNRLVTGKFLGKELPKKRDRDCAMR